MLKREVVRTRESELEKGAAYRAMLVRAIHGCATRFATVADAAVHVLMDFLGGDGAMDVVVFARAIVEQYPALRAGVLAKLLANFADIAAAPVLAVALWILGEYCEGELLEAATDELDRALGEPPFSGAVVAKPAEGAEAEAAAAAAAASSAGKSVVLSDGTYATQESVTAPAKAPEENVPNLRRLIGDGDAFLGTVAACSYTKLALRAITEHGATSPTAKRTQVKALTIICGVSKLVTVPPAQGGVKAAHSGAHADCAERLAQCARVLLEPADTAALMPTFNGGCRESFARYLARVKAAEAAEGEGEKAAAAKPRSQADDLIAWRQLRRGGASAGDVDLDEGDDLSKATGSGSGEDFGARLSHVYQVKSTPRQAECCCMGDGDRAVALVIFIRRVAPASSCRARRQLVHFDE